MQISFKVPMLTENKPPQSLIYALPSPRQAVDITVWKPGTFQAFSFNSK